MSLADEFGGSIQIDSFTTYALGGWIGEKGRHFADEVAAMSQQ